MTLDSALKLVNSLMYTTWTVDGKSFKLSKLGWSFKGFDRSVRRLGVCTWGTSKKSIGLSKIMTENRSKEEVEQTIRHEIGHAIDVEIRGTSSHDWRWKSIASQVGYTGERTTIVSAESKINAYKYVVFCEEHGVIGGYMRMPKGNRICKRCRKPVLILSPSDSRVLNFKKAA